MDDSVTRSLGSFGLQGSPQTVYDIGNTVTIAAGSDNIAEGVDGAEDSRKNDHRVEWSLPMHTIAGVALIGGVLWWLASR